MFIPVFDRRKSVKDLLYMSIKIVKMKKIVETFFSSFKAIT